MRGEHEIPFINGYSQSGPSLRARGALPGRSERQLHAGTIPACAGSTPITNPMLYDRWDHPRVRGEHEGVESIANLAKGPSPRARGAHLSDTHLMMLAGTIPACAGSTVRSAGSVYVTGDHPRVRGEHPGPVREPGRLRGTIPACAGSTRSPLITRLRPWDHPRVRGEHWYVIYGPRTLRGPSPRARGAQLLQDLGGGVAGTIPACAGST